MFAAIVMSWPLGILAILGLIVVLMILFWAMPTDLFSWIFFGRMWLDAIEGVIAVIIAILSGMGGSGSGSGGDS